MFNKTEVEIAEEKRKKAEKAVVEAVQALWSDETKDTLASKAKADNKPEILRKNLGTVAVELRIG